MLSHCTFLPLSQTVKHLWRGTSPILLVSHQTVKLPFILNLLLFGALSCLLQHNWNLHPRRTHHLPHQVCLFSQAPHATVPLAGWTFPSIPTAASKLGLHHHSNALRLLPPAVSLAIISWPLCHSLTFIKGVAPVGLSQHGKLQKSSWGDSGRVDGRATALL